MVNMHCISATQGQASHALWQAWAIMESRQGDQAAVRYLFKRGLEASPRSRYLHLAWATWEAEQGRRSFARKLLQRGHEGNRRDPAILQVVTFIMILACSSCATLSMLMCACIALWAGFGCYQVVS